jgi:CTP:molybdopterin cytidylyltransferase MocA
VTGEPVGLVLAAGSGERFGCPKALARDEHGAAFVARAVAALVHGGIGVVYVVVGASAEAVGAAVPTGAHIVEAVDWAEGMGASLRAGLAAVEAESPDAVGVLVMLVDTPDVGPDVVRRLTTHAAPDVLARAAYQARPGHPVLIGREHWAGAARSASGDRGARDYLGANDVHLVECGDISTGVDIDTAEAWRHWHSHAGDPPL